MAAPKTSPEVSEVDVQNQSYLYYPGEGPIHRSQFLGSGEFALDVDGCKTVYELGLTSYNKYKDLPNMGVRTKNPDGSWGDYKFCTYADTHKNSDNFAAGLRDLGVNPQEFVGLYSINRPEWIITMSASVTQSMPIVPLYDTLGPDAVKYIVNHAELSTVVCSAAAFPKLAQVSSSCPTLKRVILMDAIPPNAQSLVPASVELHYFQDVLARGARNPKTAVAPSPSDLFCIMYTSGTTGDPKGVMLTHRNMVASAAGARRGVELGPGDAHLSYLPLAHIYELTINLVGMNCGGRMGFWRGDILGLLDDIQTLKPTMFVGVPRVFNRIYDKILATVADSNRLRQAIFSYALSAKRSAIETGGSTPLLDRIVFKKIKDQLGGNVRVIVSGSAPLGSEVHEFLRIVTGAVVRQGYGLTETAAVCSVQLSADNKTSGHVGPPSPGCEIKLVDVPEMGYVSTGPTQRGEICVRGPNIFIGYYKAQDKTDEVLTKDGWFHTGDIGEWLPNGCLKIIDRKKNIFKLAQGEYVAVEMIETFLLRAKYVAQIFIHGDSLKDYLVAVVVPDPETVLPWARANGLSGDLATLVRNPRLKKLIYEDIVNVGTANKLSGFQLPRNIHLESEQWTPESGLLTPSMKLKRPTIKSHYKAIIEQLYLEPRMDGTPQAKL